MTNSRELSPVTNFRAEAIVKKSTISEAEESRLDKIRKTKANWTPETVAAVNKSISDALKGKPKPREQVEKQSPIWTRVRPLVLREGLTSEIMDITGFTKAQINNAKYSRKHPWWSQVPGYSDPGKETERRRKSHQGKPNNLKNRHPLSGDQRRSNAFAGSLIEAGLIMDNLFFWDKLSSLYESQERELPQDFSERLRLEFFMKAHEAAIKGDFSLIEIYRKLGTRIDSAWFSVSLAIDERAIVNVTNRNRLHDEIGFYRIIQGRKWREPIFDDGKIAFDNSIAAQRRVVARNFNPRSARR